MGPPVDRSPDTEGPVTPPGIIATAFTKDSRNVDSSPKHDVKRSRQFQVISRQVEDFHIFVRLQWCHRKCDMSIADIFDVGMQKKVESMLTVLPGRLLRTLNNAIEKSRGNFDDAVDMILRTEKPTTILLTLNVTLRDLALNPGQSPNDTSKPLLEPSPTSVRLSPNQPPLSRMLESQKDDWCRVPRKFVPRLAHYVSFSNQASRSSTKEACCHRH
jgi:hypothetical protein